MTDAIPDVRREGYRGLTGHTRKFFRDPFCVGCKRGECPRCLDNAKWNGDFEKFMDLTYYSWRVER